MQLPAHAGTWRCALSGALGGGKLCASEIAPPSVLSRVTSTVGNLSGQCVACGASRKTRPSVGPMRAVALCDARMRCDLELCSKELPPWALYPGSSTSVSALVAGSVMWPGWRDLRLHPRVRRSLPIGLLSLLACVGPSQECPPILLPSLFSNATSPGCLSSISD